MSIPKNYRLVPVAMSPAIKDAIIESGHFTPESLWQSIIAKIDLVSGHTPVDSYQPAPIQSAELAGSWKQLVDLAIEVLRSHIEPDGISDGMALSRMYGIFDGPQYRAALSAAQQQAITVPAGWKLVPVEVTPGIMAAAAIAAWPVASAEDMALARLAAPMVLMQMDLAPGCTVESVAGMLATMAPAYRAMLAAAPQPPVTPAHALTDAEIERITETDFYNAANTKTMDTRCKCFARAIAAHLARKG